MPGRRPLAPSLASASGSQQQPIHKSDPAYNPPPRQNAAYQQQYSRTPQMLDHEDVEPCDPFYCQLTTGAFPSSEKVHEDCGVQLGAVIQPLCDNPALPELSVVNFGAMGVLRCRSCRAYINPYIRLQANCRSWLCNFCSATNEITSQYVDMLQPSGNVPGVLRPELTYASVEIVAPDEYMVRAPQAPAFLFVICVNKRAIESGMTAIACETILSCLKELPGEPRTRIGILTFDSQVHFYQLSGEITQPKMYVMSNVDDPYIPLPPDEFVVNISDSEDLITELLEQLPRWHETTTNTNNCFGAAVACAFQIMEQTGGKVQFFNYGIPKIGVSKLQERQRSTASDKQHLQIKRQIEDYLLKSVDFAKVQASCDLFAFADDTCDLPTIGAVSRQSGGDLRFYRNFREDLHGDSFASELRRSLTRDQGWESVIRVRVSKGFTVGDHYGHFFMRARNLVCCPCVHGDQTVALSIKAANSGDKHNAFNQAYVQTALLYTTSHAQRRIRVHTVRVPLVNNPAQVISQINVNTYMNIITRQALQKMIRDGLPNARVWIQHSMVKVLQKYTAGAGRTAYLRSAEDYPEQISTWPETLLGALKCVAFRDPYPVFPDDRYWHFTWINNSPMDRLDVYFRPIMYDVSEIYYEPSCCTYGEDGTLILPPEVNLTKDSLDNRSIFLVDDGVQLVMWVGADSDPNMLHQLFGIEDVVDKMDLLPPVDNEPEDSLLSRLYNLFDHCRSSCLYQRLHVVGEGSNWDKGFFRQILYEDRTDSVMGREEFFQFLGQQTAPRAS